MTQYIHKDKQFFNEACKLFPSFTKRFKAACKSQMNDDSGFILVERSDCSGFFHWSICIPKSDIEVKEDIKPYVWYDRSEFDDNPNDYALVEMYGGGDDYFLCTTINKSSVHSLFSTTKKFMYIKRPE